MANDQGTKTSVLMLVFQFILAIIFYTGFIMISYAVFFSNIAELEGTQKDIALYLLGILSAGLMQWNNFFAGSSIGSKLKDILKPKVQ